MRGGEETDLEDVPVMGEVAIGTEDFPIMTKCDRADEHIYWRGGDACAAALIRGARGFLVVHSCHWSIGKISKEVTKPSERASSLKPESNS